MKHALLIGLAEELKKAIIKNHKCVHGGALVKTDPVHTASN